MKKCAILTMDKLDDFVVYDQMLDAPLTRCGWRVEHISWRQKGVNWDQFDVVIIRSTWDYQDEPVLFMHVLKAIDESSALLLNPLSVVEWNIDKQYLKRVQSSGAEIVPTLWVEAFDFDEVANYFTFFDTEQIVIKPTISANADNTFWLKKHDYVTLQKTLIECLTGRFLMVQPFIESIIDVGEYSVFYFADQYSHSIMKTPKSGDFRVQEEHGGLLRLIEADEPLLCAAQKALQTIPEKVMYARIDLVEHQGHYKVMEIELIEPSLYFNLDENAAARFAKALDQWVTD